MNLACRIPGDLQIFEYHPFKPILVKWAVNPRAKAELVTWQFPKQWLAHAGRTQHL